MGTTANYTLLHHRKNEDILMELKEVKQSDSPPPFLLSF
jgi:hypothetical protein